MYDHCRILLLTIFIENNLAAAGTNTGEFCGDLSGVLSCPVQEGHYAILVYTPCKKYLHRSRQWIRIEHPDRLLVFDSATNSSISSKILEVSFGNENQILLIIQRVTFDDAGNYYVICGQRPIVYSRPYRLNITKGNETTEVENPTLSQPIDKTTLTKNAQTFDNNSAYENKEIHSAKDKTMTIVIVIGIAVGIVATLAVVLVILLVCKHHKSPNSINITNKENHTMEVTPVASTRNDSSDPNLGYVCLLPASRCNNEREYADLMTSQPHQDYENQQCESTDGTIAKTLFKGRQAGTSVMVKKTSPQ